MKTFFGPGGPTVAPQSVSTEPSTRSLDAIQVQPFSFSQWRVYDSHQRSKDPLDLLGFIEAINNRYEVMEFAQGETGIAWFCYSSLAEAKAHFARSIGSVNAVQAK